MGTRERRVHARAARLRAREPIGGWVAPTLELFLWLARVDALEDAELPKVLERDLQLAHGHGARHVPPRRSNLLLCLPDRVAILELLLVLVFYMGIDDGGSSTS